MARKVNALTKNKIKKWEGLRLEAYQDEAGVWTIGYGSTSGVTPGLKISKPEADKRLVSDLKWAEEAVDSLVKVELTDNQFGALVSFVFNVGVTAFKNSTLLRELNKGNYDRVPAELMRWNKITVNGRKVPNRGLTNRRSAEVGLWSAGEFVVSNTIEPVVPVNNRDNAVKYGVSLSGVGTAGQVVTESANQIALVADYSSTLRLLFVLMILVGVGLTTYYMIKSKSE